MVEVEPVNSWGGGHVARLGASRSASGPANISTRLRSGEDSAAASAAVVSCESAVTQESDLARVMRIVACESRVKARMRVLKSLSYSILLRA
jgi:hypothetical protein